MSWALSDAADCHVTVIVTLAPAASVPEDGVTDSWGASCAGTVMV